MNLHFPLRAECGSLIGQSLGRRTYVHKMLQFRGRGWRRISLVSPQVAESRYVDLGPEMTLCCLDVDHQFKMV